MLGGHLLSLTVILTLTTSPVVQGADHHDEKAAIESTVRNYEYACERFDFARANALLAPGARWIEDSYPEPAAFNGKGWSKRWEAYKAAQLRIDYQLHDVDTRIRDGTAWVTLTLESTVTADNQAAAALNGNQREWRGTFVESFVLVRASGGWRIALGHTSLLPESKP